MKVPDDLELGQIDLKRGKPEEALKSLHAAVLKHIGQTSFQTLDSKTIQRIPAELLSYYGLCVALVENRVQQGLNLCKKAIEKDILRPEFYLNLGKVYMKANQKVKALNTFRKGLQITERNSELMQELKRYGTRRMPALQFLNRSHFLNRYIGLILNRLSTNPEGKGRSIRPSGRP